MGIKEFRDKLEKAIEDSGLFITYDNRDKDFDLNDNEIAICGENEKEVFAITIIKVKP